MKFSIQEGKAPEGEAASAEDQPKQFFFTFQEASIQTGIPSKVILRVLQSRKQKYVRRSDKKVFWIRDEEEVPFIQIDGKDFSSAEEIRDSFGLSRTVFFNQLRKKKTHFLDSQEKSHEVTWTSPTLDFLLKTWKEKELVEKSIRFSSKKGLPKRSSELESKLDQCIKCLLSAL